MSSYDFQAYEALWQNPLSEYNRILEPFLQQTLKPYTASSLLEIGFGSAHIPKILIELGFNGVYDGVDISEAAVHFARETILNSHFSFQLYENFKQTTVYDLAIFCLSSCEMQHETLINYLQTINSKELLIINPSSLTQYYESVITKPFYNKLTSRLGGDPVWHMHSKVSPYNTNRRISRQKKLIATTVKRSLGQIMQIAHDARWRFEKYTNLEYTTNTIHTAPVSKFEALLFQKG
jgi:SAM-dependent methyltransferase